MCLYTYMHMGECMCMHTGVVCLHTIWNGVCVRTYTCVYTWSGWSQLVTKNGWVELKACFEVRLVASGCCPVKW